MNLALGLRTVHCRCVWQGGLQAFSSSALKSGHFHTIKALLSRKCSSAKYTAQKTWHPRISVHLTLGMDQLITFRAFYRTGRNTTQLQDTLNPRKACYHPVPNLRGGADKLLARPGLKQATATKLGIYSTYSPRSSIHFLARSSNFCKPLKKIQKVVRPIRSPRHQWPPRRTKNCNLSIVFFFSPGNRW